MARVTSFATSATSLSDLVLGFEEADLVGIFAFLEIGSNDIVRGLSGTRGPMSTVSIRDTLRSQLEVAAIDVGRVMVARIM